jgi:hypothetical protein
MEYLLQEKNAMMVTQFQGMDAAVSVLLNLPSLALLFTIITQSTLAYSVP